jgi:translation initiation factor 5B
MKEDGRIVSRVRAIQSGGEKVEKALKGEQVAVSLDDAQIGKNLEPGDIVYTFLTNEEQEALLGSELSEDERAVMSEIRRIKKK